MQHTCGALFGLCNQQLPLSTIPNRHRHWRMKVKGVRYRNRDGQREYRSVPAVTQGVVLGMASALSVVLGVFGRGREETAMSFRGRLPHRLSPLSPTDPIQFNPTIPNGHRHWRMKVNGAKWAESRNECRQRSKRRRMQTEGRYGQGTRASGVVCRFVLLFRFSNNARIFIQDILSFRISRPVQNVLPKI
jgi:hypothetical protein